MGSKFLQLSFVLHALAIASVLAQNTDFDLPSSGDGDGEEYQSDTGGTVAASADESWLTNLAWNLFGYATLIVPGIVIIRMIKNSSFNERAGELVFRLLNKHFQRVLFCYFN